MTYEQWLELSGWQSRHIESGIERFDGLDLSEQLRAEYRRYLGELDRTDPAVLEQYDLADQLAIETGEGGEAELHLPEPYRRLVAIQLRGWARPARIIDSQDREAMQTVLAGLGNQYAEPGTERPLAVRYGRKYQLYPKTQDNKIITATAV